MNVVTIDTFVVNVVVILPEITKTLAKFPATIVTLPEFTKMLYFTGIYEKRPFRNILRT